MTYVPHTDDDRRAMLDTLGHERVEELFADIPEHARFPHLDLPAALSEMEIAEHMRRLADRNITVTDSDSFLGAGAYTHFIPATVNEVLGRGEFYTAYTPYQSEASQGMLQAMFEYQTMICNLTGMDVTNASHYDGSTALAEAVRMALDVTSGGRQKVVVGPAVNPRYEAVVETYLQGTDAQLIRAAPGTNDPAGAAALVDDDTAALMIQNPNFLGQFEDLSRTAELVHAAGALLIVVADPISLGLFKAPGEYGADVVVAEGQPLGIPPSFGGPYLGIFATRQQYVRRMPGRLVGETVDVNGKRGYVLTLGAREQHIRRAKATSNICTNAGLMALAAATYLATMGERGLREVAELCYQKSHYAAAEIAALEGFAVNPGAPDKIFFKEFVVRLPRPADEVNRMLRDRAGIIGGFDLGETDPELDHYLLIAVTEMNTKRSIDRLVDELRKVTLETAEVS